MMKLSVEKVVVGVAVFAVAGLCVGTALGLYAVISALGFVVHLLQGAL